nr:uncharacterized protein LOC115114299 [Oncorhynchus nerka]XP_029498284.1 uncharacterized protein LOC115114299 [Oncorhynchus nerka]
MPSGPNPKQRNWTRQACWAFPVGCSNEGESLSNTVYLLREMEGMRGKNINLIFMCDIACKMQPYVQMKFNTQYVEGAGLADREQMERLWSYLRCFGKVTKEMTPSHRIDLLLHFSTMGKRYTRGNVVDSLPQRFSRATKVATGAESEMAEIAQSLPGTTLDTIRDWGRNVSVTLERQKPALCWEEQYVAMLKQHTISIYVIHFK